MPILKAIALWTTYKYAEGLDCPKENLETVYQNLIKIKAIQK